MQSGAVAPAACECLLGSVMRHLTFRSGGLLSGTDAIGANDRNPDISGIRVPNSCRARQKPKPAVSP